MEYKDPRSLLSIDRLDVFLKKLYFDVICCNRTRDASLIISLYRKHIRCRTGGIEPQDLNKLEHYVSKTCIEDYEREALKLYRSVSENGFQPDRMIAISDELLLVNGAHRLAVSISLGMQTIPVTRSLGGGKWGADWFHHHLSTSEYLFLLKEYALFCSCSVPLLLWGITEEYWEDLIYGLQQKGLKVAVVQVLDLHENFDGFYQMIHELYGVPLQSNENIRRKAIIHGSYSMKIAVLQVEPVAGKRCESSFYEYLGRVKHEIRDEFNDRINKNLFLTLHAPSCDAEKQRMLQLLYSRSNLRFYRYYRFNDISKDIALRLAIEGFKVALEKAGLQTKDVCVVGSAVLGVLGVRQPNDIDFVVSSKLDSAAYRTAMNTQGQYDLLNDYSLRMRNGEVTTDEVIHSSRYNFCYSGIKFADPFYVFLKKNRNGIAKDSTDRELMIGEIRRRRKDGQSRFMRDELLWLEAAVRGQVS